MSVYTCFLYLLRDCLLWLLNCCKYSKKKDKYLTDDEIENKAKQMLNDYLVTTYANNRYLQKIPEERKIEQYKLYVKEIKDLNY